MPPQLGPRPELVGLGPGVSREHLAKASVTENCQGPTFLWGISLFSRLRAPPACADPGPPRSRQRVRGEGAGATQRVSVSVPYTGPLSALVPLLVS